MTDAACVNTHTVCLVACTSRKGAYPAKAELVYKSPLFTAAKSYAERRADQWFILSAKHGLLSPNDVIAPYNESLLSQTEEERRRWARNVHQKLRAQIPRLSRIVFLSGSAYRSHLEPALRHEGHAIAAPMSALGIGSQVAWLQRVERESARLKYLDYFYGLLRRLMAMNTRGRGRLSEQSATSIHSARGIYFFFESGEMRMTAPFQERVVRVGTHAVSEGSKATLWNRLRTHRGATDGAGNHRGSIFRLHVGECLLRKGELQSAFPTWGAGQSAASEIRQMEEEVELAVSESIGQMSVGWLEVDDEPSADSDRTYLERNLIALLAGPTGPLDLPSKEWLGRWSGREAIRFSGLWNVNHVYEKFDPTSLEILEEYVKAAEGSRPKPNASLAPKGWRLRLQDRGSATGQIELI